MNIPHAMESLLLDPQSLILNNLVPNNMRQALETLTRTFLITRQIRTASSSITKSNNA